MQGDFRVPRRGGMPRVFSWEYNIWNTNYALLEHTQQEYNYIQQAGRQIIYQPEQRKCNIT